MPFPRSLFISYAHAALLTQCLSLVFPSILLHRDGRQLDSKRLSTTKFLSGGPRLAEASSEPSNPDASPWSGQRVVVVTTASLPWMTGTSVNPLLRAVELAKCGAHVNLMLPWLSPETLRDEEGQAAIYGSHRFETPAEQEIFLREWVQARQGQSYHRADASFDAIRSQNEGHHHGLDAENDSVTGDIDSSQLLQGDSPHRGTWAVQWYPGRYCPSIGSIVHDDRDHVALRTAIEKGCGAVPRLRKESILNYLPAGKWDMALLEEPEHLSWYHNGGRWGDYFPLVVGIVHTDYLQYSRAEPEYAEAKAMVTLAFQNLAYRAHCDKVVCLSPTLRGSGAPLSTTTVCNVHGVRDEFLAIGRSSRSGRRSSRLRHIETPMANAATKDATVDGAKVGPFYFLAKKQLAKGYRELLKLMAENPDVLALLDEVGPIALLGSGPDEDAIHASALESLGASRVLLLPAHDHAKLHDLLSPYDPKKTTTTTTTTNADDIGIEAGDENTPSISTSKVSEPWSVFVNPSTSEVLCTATAEALAMGKTVIVPRHPSNEFFYQFSNCRVYSNPADFALHLCEAARAPYKDMKEGGDPDLLLQSQLDAELQLLSWGAAMDRLADTIALSPTQSPSPSPESRSIRNSKSNSNTKRRPLRRPTSSMPSKFAHEVNLSFRRGLVGKVMHYDCYMVLEEWDDSTPEATERSWRRAREYLLGI